MEDRSYIAITIGVVVPVLVFGAVALWVCVLRRRGQTDNPGYAQVSHTLDEEEIEFKRFIESQVPGLRDDIDDFFAAADTSLTLDDTTHDSSSLDPDSFTFDEEERNHLAILEKFRSSLVSGGAAATAEVGADAEAGADDESGGEMDDAYSPVHQGSEPPDEIRT